jgi:hypothetical protein
VAKEKNLKKKLFLFLFFGRLRPPSGLARALWGRLGRKIYFFILFF